MFRAHMTCCATLTALALFTTSAKAEAPLNLVPSEADAVVYFNVRQLLGTKLVKEYALPAIEKALEQNKNDEQLTKTKQFLKLMDLDVQKDIDGVLVCNVGTDAKQMMVILQGRFNAKRIQFLADGQARTNPTKFSKEKVGTVDLYTVREGDTPTYVALLGDKTLVGSPEKKFVVAAIKGATGKPNKVLAGALKSVSSEQSTWLVAVVPDQAKQMLAVQPGLQQLAPKLMAISGNAKLDESLAVGIQVHTTDVQAAQVLKTIATQLRGVLLLGAGNNPELAPIMNDLRKSLKITTKEKTVGLDFTLTKTALMSIKDLIEKSQP